MACQLALRSVGYRGMQLPGLPFDKASGTVPHDAGRIRLQGGGVGTYVVGWAKRGPHGIIATNLQCAEETAATLEADLLAGSLALGTAREGASGLRALLRTRGVPLLDAAAWTRLDAAEQAAGNASGKPREKIINVAEALHITGGRWCS